MLKKMTNKELYELVDRDTVHKELFKRLAKLQSDVLLDDKLSLKNQCLMAGINFMVNQILKEAKEEDYEKELKVIEYNHEQFYKLNQKHLKS